MFLKRDSFWVGLGLVGVVIYFGVSEFKVLPTESAPSSFAGKVDGDRVLSGMKLNEVKTTSSVAGFDKSKIVASPARVSARIVMGYQIRAMENGVSLAQEYRRKNPPNLGGFWDSYQGYASVSQKDTCPMGDGWVKVDVTRMLGEGKGVTTPLMCSTFSKTIGCMPEEEFKTSKWVGNFGNCAKGLPIWLPDFRA